MSVHWASNGLSEGPLSGDWNDSMWSCGQSVGLINDVPTCSELVQRMVKEAEEHLAKGVACVVPSKL